MPVVNLTAFSTGTYAGLAIFQARSDASAVTVSGNANLNLNGAVLYAANVQSDGHLQQQRHGGSVASSERVDDFR